MSHVFAARSVLPSMLEKGQGYLLNTSSAAGLLNQVGSAPYSTTKHAAIGFAEWLSITYGNRGIKVSVLCPQAVRTNMTAGGDGGVAGLDGMLEPEQLADTVIETLSEERFLVLPHPEVLPTCGARRMIMIAGSEACADYTKDLPKCISSAKYLRIDCGETAGENNEKYDSAVRSTRIFPSNDH